MAPNLRKLTGLLSAALPLLILAACAEPTQPHSRAEIAGEQNPAAQTTAPFVAKGTILRRTDPLREDEWAWTILYPNVDGSMHLNAAGLKVEFPAGAVAKPTLVWVVAHRGDQVIYSFGPHGTQFSQQVKIQQDMKGTTAWRNAALAYDLRGGYVPDGPADIATDGTASIAELFGVEIAPDNLHNPRVAKFYTTHFSGYILASGCRDFPDQAFDR